MSSSSPSEGSSPSVDKDTTTKTGQLKPSDVKGDFFTLVQDQLVSMSKDGRLKAAWRGEDAKSYASEMLLLQEHYKPLIWGVGSFVITFASFRISKFTGPILRKPTGNNTTGYTFQSTSSSSSKTQTDPLNYARSIPTDLALSALIGCSATMFLLDQEKLLRDVSNVPLVKGRSLISHELCHPFRQKYKQIPNHFWINKNDTSLQAVRNFVHNCQRREKVEKMVIRQRQQQQQQQQHSANNNYYGNDNNITLNHSQPVSIPRVPWDLEVDDEEQD